MESLLPQSWLRGAQTHAIDELQHSKLEKLGTDNKLSGSTRTVYNEGHPQKEGSKPQQSQQRTILGDLSTNGGPRQAQDVKAAKSASSVSSQSAPSLQTSHRYLPSKAFVDPGVIDGGRHDHTAPADASQKWRPDVKDIDAQNAGDITTVAAYAQSIFEHLREKERTRRPTLSYLETFQADMNSKMRAILVDWLVEVAEEYRLCTDTLYLAINYLDRYLSLQRVNRSNLQLVGVTCMWIAAKYEEIYPPNVKDFCYITDNTYTKSQVVAMEESVLKALNYELCIPTAKTFLRRLLQVCSPDEGVHYLSNYLTELSLLDPQLSMEHLPSQVAAAAVFLAHAMLGRQPWDATLEHYSTYEAYQLYTAVNQLAAVHTMTNSNPQLAALKDKYGHSKFKSVSQMPCTPISMHWFK